jgi:uncharacterized protein GlcG (DUF336 family)
MLGIESRSYRQGGARRRQPRWEDDQGHKISRQRLALAVLQSRESRQHLGTRGQIQTNSAARNAAKKVFTSSRLRQPSGTLGRAALAEGWDVHYHGESRYLGWDGGALVFYREQCVGSVAASGLTGVEDLEIVELGVNAILATLD